MKLELEAGGDLELLDSDGEQAVVSSSRPFPPGASLVARREGESSRFTLKVRQCQSEGARFRIQGRFVNLSRAQRDDVLAFVVAKKGG